MSEDPAKQSRGRGHPRQRYRDQQHQSAHAGAAGHDAVKVPDHPLIPRGPAPLIASQGELAELLAHIRSIGSFAYDSEFIGEMSYVPKLCVLQVATRERVALVDPLAGLDLTGFWELIVDPAVEKIVHAGQQDLEPAFRILKRLPANIFDTQIAAGFVGLAYPPALSKLVRELLGVRLGKGFTFTHWDQRPLSAVQLRYAADDVRFLPAVRDDLGRRLAALGHEDWAREESAGLCDAALYEFDPERDYLKLRGVGGLAAQNLAVLRELMRWREEAASQANLPPRSFLKDEILVDMARSPIKAVADLDRVRGLPRPVENEHGATLLALTQRAMSLPAAELPVVKHLEESPSERFGIDAFWAVVQAWCLGQGIDPAVATSRADASRFYHDYLDEKPLDEQRLMKGWRRAAIGEALVAMLRGELWMELEWTEGRLRAEKMKG